jgi:hypothetical protein
VRCCSEPGHMTEEDAAMVNGFRKTVDLDNVEKLEDLGGMSVLEGDRRDTGIAE